MTSARTCALVLILATTSCTATKGGTDIDNKPFVLAGVGNLTKVAQLTGAESANHTDRFAVYGTDLGSMFTMDDRTYVVFGDTFGERTDGLTGAGGSFWRSNVMGYTTDRNPADGITLHGMITDETGLAKELLDSRKVDGTEMTVIPTYGFAVGRTMYLHYMSVRHWGDPGRWDVNQSGLARSTDRGATWTKLAAPTWPGDSGFAQVAVTQHDGYLYFWGIPAGRFGGVSLMRVPPKSVEDPAAYQYFAGDGRWETDQRKAAQVVDDTVGELSVVHNRYLDRWIMMYLREGTGVVLREGITPWGPWSEPREVVSHKDYPGLYAPFQYPAELGGDGQRVYFNLSLWGPYNVFVFSVDLRRTS